MLDSKPMSLTALVANSACLLDALPDSLAVLDATGKILYLNAAWQQETQKVSEPLPFWVGQDYLKGFELLFASNGADLTAMTAGLRAVLSGLQPQFQLKYAHAVQFHRWFEVQIKPYAYGPERGVLVQQRDVTAQWQKQEFLEQGTKPSWAIQGAAERRELQLAIEEREESYRALLDTLAEGLVMLGQEGRILACNARAETILGLRSDQMLRWVMLDASWRAVHLDGQPFSSTEHPLHKALRTGEASFEVGMGFRKPIDGTQIWISMNTRPIFRATEANPYAAIVTFFDITHQKIEEETNQNLHTLGIALSKALDITETIHLILTAAITVAKLDCGGIYLVDETTGAIDLVINQGLSPEFVAKTKYYPADAPQTKLIMTGQPVYAIFEKDKLHPDDIRGKEGIQSLAIVPVLCEGQVVACLNIGSRAMQEITPAARATLETIVTYAGSILLRLRHEKVLRQREEHLRVIFTAATAVAFISIDVNLPTLPILEFSPGAECVFGYQREEILGKPFVQLVLPNDQAQVLERSRVLRQQKIGFKGEVIYRRKSGEAFPAQLHSYPLLNENNEVLASLGVIIDLSERKQAEEVLRSREAILEAVSFAATRFLAETNWQQNIQTVLAHLGTATNVSRTYIFENHVADDGSLLMSQRYEWTRDGVRAMLDAPELQGLSFQKAGFGRWSAILGRNEPIHGPLTSFPCEEQELLVEQDILSLAVVPIFVQQSWWGFIGFDDCKTARLWAEAEVEALSAAASIIGMAIQRDRVEERARQVLIQEEIIRAQEITLAELSTPLIPISEHVVVMPLVGMVDSRRAERVMEVLLLGIAEHQARIAIIDITGVSVIDAQVANALILAAQAVRLLGSQVVLTGIQPHVAQTLVGLGVDLKTLVTRSTLQSGIIYATKCK